MTKLQISLTDQEAEILSIRAMSLGYSLTRFVKFLLGREALEFDQSIPAYPLSKKALNNIKQAMAEFKADKVFEAHSIEELDEIITHK